MEYNISFFLDTRRKLKQNNKKYPVKLRVYYSLIRKAKLYSTKINLTENDFNDILNSNVKVTGRKRDTKLFLDELNIRAHKVCSTLEPFSFDQFEKKMFRNHNAGNSVLYHYDNKLNILKNNKQVGTESNYNLSLKSIGNFLIKALNIVDDQEKKETTNKYLNALTFQDITAEWLNNYENYMVNDLSKSYTTVSMYLRCLRTIFNDAISENDIDSSIYPFGRAKGKYVIPNSQKKKKALTNAELKLLFNSTPNTPDQLIAKDFWFFSYSLYGINFKDISLLTFENIENDRITYFRAKTKTTKKNNLQEISVDLNEYSKSIIAKHSKDNKSKKGLIFSIINKDDDAYTQKKKVKNFISFVNLHFDKYAKSLGITNNISTMWARHSFATISIQKGASIEFISEALNHSNVNVTKGYFAGFEDEFKKQFSNSLMDF